MKREELIVGKKYVDNDNEVAEIKFIGEQLVVLVDTKTGDEFTCDLSYVSEEWKPYQESPKPKKLYAYKISIGKTADWTVFHSSADKCYIRRPQFDLTFQMEDK